MRHYTDLTVHQRISLKGEFATNPLLQQYRAIMMFFNFVLAVEYFLNHDTRPLIRHIFRDI